MKLEIRKSGYMKDIESIECPPSDWVENTLDWYILFKGYDLDAWCCSQEELRMHEDGNDFICVVELYNEPFDGSEIKEVIELAKFPAKDEAEARRLLQIAADAIYGKDE